MILRLSVVRDIDTRIGAVMWQMVGLRLEVKTWVEQRPSFSPPTDNMLRTHPPPADARTAKCLAASTPCV